jgi:hypothetical protein
MHDFRSLEVLASSRPSQIQKSRRPLQRQFSMMNRAIAQIQIDELLIGQSGFYGDSFEVCHAIPIEPERHRLFEQFDVRILSAFHFRKIIMVFHGLTPIILLFASIRLSRRNDANQRFFFSIAMTDDQSSQSIADTEQNESRFVFGMIGVEIDFGSLIEESRLRLFKCYAVLAAIGPIFLFIPNELQSFHTYSVHFYSI